MLVNAVWLLVIKFFSVQAYFAELKKRRKDETEKVNEVTHTYTLITLFQLQLITAPFIIVF